MVLEMEIPSNFLEELDKLYREMPSVFDLNNNKKVSSILLFKDYIHQLRMWKEKLNITYPPFGYLPSGNNLILDINQDLKNKMMPIMEFYNSFIGDYSFDENLRIGTTRYLNYLFVYYFIYWEVLKNEEEFNGYNDSENPYRGLVKLISNDSIYSREGVNIAGVTINFNKSLVLPSLDDDFLKFIDSKYKLTMDNKIPNQEEVNQLWEKFSK